MRSITFNKSSAVMLSLIGFLGLATAAFYKNYIGMLGVFGVVAVLSIGQYLKNTVTEYSYPHLIDLICSLAPLATLTTVAEYVILLFSKETVLEFRCGSLLYLHPNYLGTVTAIIAVLCVYRFFTNKEHRLRYIISGICCLICIVLTGSLFAYIEMTVAAFIMLLFCKKWKSLSIFIACIIAVAAAVYFVPELIPRLEQADSSFEVRLDVWRASIELFKQSPIFGEGVLAYMHEQTTVGTVGGIKMFPTPHAHNILLDSLINYGIVGTVLFTVYFITQWKSALLGFKQNYRSFESALMMGVIVGAFVHGFVDVTLMWIQPGLLFLTVLSCCGFISKKKQAQNT